MCWFTSNLIVDKVKTAVLMILPCPEYQIAKPVDHETHSLPNL